jgi:predicted AlkP superfamily pyrophosphatase or phosphodiesterase
MPIVSKLADNGVRFLHNHAVFPTVTRGNSASLVTGVTPGKHGLTANKSIFPEYSKTEVVDALVPKLPEINELTGGKLLFVPTIGELISEHGLKWVSVVGGTSGNAYVQHANAHKFGNVVIHPEFTNPPAHHGEIVERFGDWPAKEAPAADLVRRTADVAIDYALGKLHPDVLLVWFPEPDTSQHAYGVDSPEAQSMYSLADAQLGRILDAIGEQGDDPDIFIVSDHGYSTIDSVINVPAELVAAGFGYNAGEESVVIAENGGAVLLYLPQRSTKLIERLLRWLTERPWVGGIATDHPNFDEREFASLDMIGLTGRRAPDIAIAMRSRDSGDSAPLARVGTATGGKVGVGSHGGASPAEMHNTLIANGPSFHSGMMSELPSGNIDVAPTIMELLGIPLPGHFEGRVLHEALQNDNDALGEASVFRRRSTSFASVEEIFTGDTQYLCEFG